MEAMLSKHKICENTNWFTTISNSGVFCFVLFWFMIFFIHSMKKPKLPAFSFKQKVGSRRWPTFLFGPARQDRVWPLRAAACFAFCILSLARCHRPPPPPHTHPHHLGTRVSPAELDLLYFVWDRVLVCTELDDFEELVFGNYRNYFKLIYDIHVCLLTYTNLRYVFLMENESSLFQARPFHVINENLLPLRSWMA